MEEKVSVRWWNHRNAIYKAVRALQHQEMYADVVLVCENKKFEAHKFVLSACSEFFEKELSEMPYRGLFYLPAEIIEKHLVSLLDYIYKGQAVVKEDDVNDLLKAAETLGIRGLAIPFYDDDDEEPDEESLDEAGPKAPKALISKKKLQTSISRNKKIKLEETKSFVNDILNNTEEFHQKRSDSEMKSVEKTSLNSSSNNETSPKSTGENSSKATRDQSNVDVNNMLTVLINGEQNSSKRQKMRGACASDVNEEGKTADPNLVCPQCQRQFHWRSNLTKHMRTHTGEKPYTCSECDYKTGYSEALKRHVRTHTGEKPYECVLCDYKCKDNSSLKLHMNKHTGESSFPCNICSYKTRIKTAFMKHMATHDDPIPHNEVKFEENLDTNVEIPPINYDDYPCVM